jgi:hypothetical protein
MNEYLCEKLDSLTAWLGAIGIILMLFRWETGLFALFLLLIFLPEGKFSDFFKKMSDKIKEKTDHEGHH